MCIILFLFRRTSREGGVVKNRKGNNGKGRDRMKYQIEENCLTIFLPKELDHHQTEEIRREADRQIERNHVKYVIFDFGETSFMDSSGIGLILGRIRQVGPIGGRVYLFGGSPSMQKMWRMSGILQQVEVLETIEEMKEVYE